MNVFITGISKGLGRALTNLYASGGHRVLGVSRGVPVDMDGSVAHRSVDVCSPDLENEVAILCKGVPHIDLLINNAGAGSFGAALHDVSPEEVSLQFQLHCLAPLRVTRALLPKLLAAPAPKVFHITSRFGSFTQNLRGDFKGMEISYAYRIAKAAQNMLSVCMAADPSLSGILVASVNPGSLRSVMGGPQAPHSLEEAAVRIAALAAELSEPGLVHAFGEDAVY